MLQKFSHPPLLTPSQQLILPECSPHIDLCSSFNLITAAFESFSPSFSQNSGCGCNFPLLPYVSLLPQKALQGKEEWKSSSFSSIQPAERNRGQESSSLIPFKNLRNPRGANIWTGLWSCMCYWFLCIVTLVEDPALLFLDRKISGTEFRC